MQLLVVDDEPMVAAMFKIFLEFSGHRVTSVPDGANALAALMEQHFDLALVDLTLPQMDGWELCRRINRSYPNIPVILASGRAISGVTVREEKISVSAVLGKPFDMQRLLDTIGVASAVPKAAPSRSRYSNS